MEGNIEDPDRYPHPALLREMIAAQICAWCGREDLRSLANHTVLAHGIRAAELRQLAGLPASAPLCSPALSDRHRQLAAEQGTAERLHRPEVFLAAAATREAQFDDEQRERRVQHLNAIRSAAVQALQRRKERERADPELAAARLIAQSKARRFARDGVECGICGAWFCSVVGDLTPFCGHADPSSCWGKRDDLEHGPQELHR